jgi:hypothetical protein
MGQISVGALLRGLRGLARTRRLAVIGAVCMAALGTGVAVGANSTATLRVTGAYRASLSLNSTGKPFTNPCMAFPHTNPGVGVFLYFGSPKPSAAIFVTLFTSGSAHNLNLAKTHRGYVRLHRFSPQADWAAGFGGKPGNVRYGWGTLSISADASSGSVNATMQRLSGPKRPVHVTVTWHCTPVVPK